MDARTGRPGAHRTIESTPRDARGVARDSRRRRRRRRRRARVGACDGPTRPSLTRDVDARCDHARDGDDDARADERDGDDDDEYEYEYDDDESSRARASIGADARVGERDDDEITAPVVVGIVATTLATTARRAPSTCRSSIRRRVIT